MSLHQPSPSPTSEAQESGDMQGDIAIIGAGIAGLSASLALRRAGLSCDLYEGRSGDAFAGMGFLLMSNGAQALKGLIGGAGEAGEAPPPPAWPPQEDQESDPLRAYALELSALCLFSHTGELIATRGAGGAYGVSRPQLMSLMSDLAAREGVRRFNAHTLSAISARSPSGAQGREGGIEMRFQEREAGPRHARCLIGADGVRSVVRRDLLGVSALSRSEILEFVGISPATALRELPLGGPLGLGGARDPRALVKLQDGARRLAFGYMPLAGEEVIWYAQMAQADAEMPLVEGEARRAALLERFGGWPPVVGALLRSCLFERTYRWDTCDLPPLATARCGGALLIGDAAHASLTLSSQGVSGALEDAVELGRVARDLALGDLTGRPDLLAPRWLELCALFEERRAPVWRRRHEEARALQRDFLAGDTRGGVPVVRS